MKSMASESSLLSSRAKNDLSNILNYYNELSKGSAKLFLDEFDDTAKLIIRHPGIAETLGANVRRFVMRGFPYNIYYIQESDNTVLILAILHKRRNPDVIKNRIEP